MTTLVRRQGWNLANLTANLPKGRAPLITWNPVFRSLTVVNTSCGRAQSKSHPRNLEFLTHPNLLTYKTLSEVPCNDQQFVLLLVEWRVIRKGVKSTRNEMSHSSINKSCANPIILTVGSRKPQPFDQTILFIYPDGTGSDGGVAFSRLPPSRLYRGYLIL